VRCKCDIFVVYLGFPPFNYLSYVTLLCLSVRGNWTIIMVKSIKCSYIMFTVVKVN